MDIGSSFQLGWFENDIVCVNCLIEFSFIFFFYKDTNKYVYNKEKLNIFLMFFIVIIKYRKFQSYCFKFVIS